MKRRRDARAAPFHRVRDDLGLRWIDEVTAVSVVVGRTRRRIESHRLFDAILSAAHLLDGTRQFATQLLRATFIGGRNVLAINVIVNETALAVVSLVAEAHVRIVRLILIAAPA